MANERTQWWLAEIGPHDIPHLIDGPHSNREGPNVAAHLMLALKLRTSANTKFAVARVELSDCVPNNQGVNREAVETMAPIIERYKNRRTPAIADVRRKEG